MGSVLKLLAGLVLAGLLAACGGGGSTDATVLQGAAAITTQPADQSVVAGTAATFTVVASAATGYQWQRSTDGGASFSAIAGATAAAYTSPLASIADSGTRYRVVVSGAGNSVTSSAATLTVLAAVVAPSISVQPADQSITAGQDASFSVTAAGTNLAYQWQGSPDGVAFTDLPGETNATLTLPAVPLAANASRVRVVVSNTAGSVTSAAAVLTVSAAQAAPAFTTHPVSVAVVAPAGATFTAVATGVPAPTLQWQRSTDGGATFADIDGETGGSFVVADTAEGDDVRIYRVVATNTVGSAVSHVATLTVTPAPVAPSFTTHPVSASIVAGQNAQFTAAATGTPTPTLQWQLSTDGGASWSNINGATGNTFDVLNAAQANNGRQFRAVASNSEGSVNSNAAVLTVTAAVVSGWQGPPTPLHVDGTASGSPALAANAAGQAIASWSQSDGIFASRYLPNSGWQAAVRVSGIDANLGFFYPAVAMNGNGQGIAVWRESDGVFYHRVQAAVFSPASGWGAPAALSVNDTSGGTVPEVAVDANGNALAIWIERASSSSPWHLVGSYFSAATGSWGTALRLDSDAIGEPTDNARVAVSAGGDAMVLWPAPAAAPGSNALWVRRMAAGGTWAAAQQIDPAAYPSPEQRIALDADGNAMAVWKKSDNPTYPSIWSIRFDSLTGTWGTAVAVETDNTNRATSPQVAFDASGQAVAVWVQFDGAQELILSNRHTVAGGWGTPQQVAAGAINNLAAPSLAVNASGTAAVAWRQDGLYIGASMQPAGAAWRTPQLAATTGTDGLGLSAAGTPMAGIDDSGNATIAWLADVAGRPRRMYGGRYR